MIESSTRGLNTASAAYSTVPGGLNGKADKYGQIASASGYFAAQGDAQGTIQAVLRATVTHDDTDWHSLYLDGSSAKLTIAQDTVWTFDVLLVGTTSGCGDSFSYHFDGCVENDGGNVSILADGAPGVIYEGDSWEWENGCIPSVVH